MKGGRKEERTRKQELKTCKGTEGNKLSLDKEKEGKNKINQ